MTITEDKTTTEHAERQFVPPQPAAAPPFTWSATGFLDWLRDNGVRIPSFTRLILTAVAMIATTVLLTPIGAAICTACVSAAMTFTASAVLLNAAWFLGALVSVYFGTKVVLSVAKYIFGEKLDRDLAATRNQVAWALTPDPKPVPR